MYTDDVQEAIVRGEKHISVIISDIGDESTAERWNGQLPKVSSGATAFIDATDLAS